MKKTHNRKITVNRIEITISTINDDDFISLTDMVKGFEGKDDLIRNWLRNRNTIEFLGVWEKINNPNFKPVEFDRFKKEAGLNNFTMRPKKWQQATNAIGIFSKAGRYGGTYAHKDIAFEFGAWLSAEFKLYLIKEFQRLKEQEAQFQSVEWQVKRELTKVNYRLQTDAIQENLLLGIDKNEHWKTYTSEADMLNIIVFGETAKEWRENNPNKTGNQRDNARVLENTIMGNLEFLNSTLIEQGVKRKERYITLEKQAEHMKSSLSNNATIKKLANPTDKLLN